MQHSSVVLAKPSSPRLVAIAVGLILVFILGALAGLTPTTRAGFASAADDSSNGADAAAPLKAVIIVGPTHGLTASNLDAGKALANQAESYGMDVRRVFHPKATWANVLANIQDANLVAYFGHGNGWPSPYGQFQEKTKNGFGLNPFEGAGKDKVEYWGGNKIRSSVVLAPNAVVLLNHLCYASGNGESFMAVPGWDVAHQRVDNFAAAFLAVGASSVFAYSSQPVTSVLDDLFTTDKTVGQIFTTSGSKATPWHGFIGWNDRKLDSVRTPGTLNYLDPDISEGFKRAVSGYLGFGASDWRAGADIAPPPGGGGDGGGGDTADTTPPSTPLGLATEALGYRRVKLTWEASTDDSTIKYRVFRNGNRIATISGTSYTDRPANPGTYKYKVRAVDAAGNRSAYSSVVEGQSIKGELSGLQGPDTVAPSTPMGLKATALGYRRVELSWKASTDDRAGTLEYRVLRNGNRIATISGTSFTDRPDVAGTYRYKVRAVDAAGNRSDFTVVVEGQSIKGAL